MYLYRHNRVTAKLLQHGVSFDRTQYTRIIALACVDVVLMVPLGAVSIATYTADGVGSFWPGWTIIHTDLAPQPVTSAQWRSSAVWSFNLYWNQCSGVVLSLVIFILFGVARNARRSQKVSLHGRSSKFSTYRQSVLVLLRPPMALHSTSQQCVASLVTSGILPDHSASRRLRAPTLGTNDPQAQDSGRQYRTVIAGECWCPAAMAARVIVDVEMGVPLRTHDGVVSDQAQLSMLYT